MTNEMMHGGEGGDAACFIEQGVPGLLASLEDILIGHEQVVAEEVVFEVLPGFFGRIALWGIGRDSDQGDITGNAQRLRAMPAGAVGDHSGVDLGGDDRSYREAVKHDVSKKIAFKRPQSNFSDRVGI